MANTKSTDEWEQVFNHFDKNKNGTLEFSELEELLRSNDSSMTKTQIEWAFTCFDGPNGDKAVTLEEFSNGIKKMMDMTVMLTEAFNEADKDGSGLLDHDESKAVLLKFYPEMPADEVEGVFVSADKDGDGKISLEEFLSACS